MKCENKDCIDTAKLLAEKEADILELLEFIKKTLIGFGVKDFNDFDALGTKLMKGIPGIMTDATIFPHRLKRRFEHMAHAKDTFRKYVYYFTQEQPEQTNQEGERLAPIKKLR